MMIIMLVLLYNDSGPIYSSLLKTPSPFNPQFYGQIGHLKTYGPSQPMSDGLIVMDDTLLKRTKMNEDTLEACGQLETVILRFRPFKNEHN